MGQISILVPGQILHPEPKKFILAVNFPSIQSDINQDGKVFLTNKPLCSQFLHEFLACLCLQSVQISYVKFQSDDVTHSLHLFMQIFHPYHNGQWVWLKYLFTSQISILTITPRIFKISILQIFWMKKILYTSQISIPMVTNSLI